MSRRRQRTSKTGPTAALATRLAVAGVALGVAGLSGCLAWAMTRPLAASPLSSMLVAVNETRADDALARGPSRLKDAEVETRAGLARAPATATGWLRLAYIRKQRAGRLDAPALDYLNRSFDAAPLGPDVTAWRVRFVFENWSEVTPELRRRALAEVMTTARYRGARAREITGPIQDPAGRLAAAMATSIARSHDPGAGS